MAMFRQRYNSAERPDAFERERRSLPGRMTDPITTGRLTDLGVGTGWRCLEVSAGDGSIAHWLAERVGPWGQVVVTDLDPQFPTGRHPPNLEVRRHDILKDDLEVSHYDLVHCRFVLKHLTDPAWALERMAAAVRPGGWLMVEEADLEPSGAADPWHPRAAKFDRIWRAFPTDSNAGVAIDHAFGRRLLGLFERLVLREVDFEEEFVMAWGGGPEARNCWMSHQRMRGPAIASGVLTPADFKELNRAYDDPTFCLIPFTVLGVWGRVPIRSGPHRRVPTFARREV
jgi:SAM-dependent methyltransferase